MSVFGSILGSAVNSAFSGLNAQTSYHYNLKLQKAINTNKHQWEVSDLRKAGLNPILSATNGMGYANAGSVAVSSSDGGLGSAETTSNTAMKLGKESNRIQEKSVDNNKDMIDSNIEKNRVDMDNSVMSTAANVELTNQSIEQLKHKIINDDAITAATIEKLIMDAESNRISANANANSAFHMGRMTDSNIEHNRFKNDNLKASTHYTGTQDEVYGNQNSVYRGEYGHIPGYIDYGVDKLKDGSSIIGNIASLYKPFSSASSGGTGANSAYKTVTRYYK